MESFINKKRVKINKEIGRWVSLGGLGVLIIGMIVSIRRPDLFAVSLGCLILGFLASTIGSYYANRWTKSPRADEILDQSLKGISNLYHLYHYLLPSNHVLLGPTGLFLLRAYLHEGPITYTGKKWKQKFSWLRALGFSGQDSLGDPVKDTQYELQRFRTWLGKRLEKDKMPEITPVVVFVRPTSELHLEQEPEIPILSAQQLKKEIRNIVKEQPTQMDEDMLYEIERAMLGTKIDEL